MRLGARGFAAGLHSLSRAVCWQAFYSASAFNQNIGSWDVGRVTSLYQLFYSANAFNQDIGGWNVAQLTSFSYVFAGSRFNRDIGGWNVASATTLDNMFNSAPAFNQNIASWNVASVADLRYMFSSGARWVYGSSLGSTCTATCSLRACSAAHRHSTRAWLAGTQRV